MAMAVPKLATAFALFLALLPLAYSLLGEGQVLLRLKASFLGAADVLSDWNAADRRIGYCSWRGVTCDNASFGVVSLNLSNLNLGGEISPSIGELKSLQFLDLRENRLTGQMPDEIGECSALRYLDLSGNNLEGDIPFSLSKLKLLEDLNLKSNQLTGSIPSTLSQIPNLKNLDLALNQLTGEIPRLIYWNEVLQFLGLRGNSLTGALSPDMCQMTGLWYFDVRGNNLTGPIPDNIGNCTSFEILDISYNQITGEIPYNIGFLQVATLSLQGNRLTGKIPEVIGLMQALAVLDLSENELVGPIPAIIGNLSYTGKLYLHGNNLTGAIPPELGNMSKLSYLQLNDNQLEGGIPPELGKLQDLFELNLANNKLTGEIPRNISSCAALNQLNVHGNKLNGTIPVGFQKLESLTYLNLSSNEFTGVIPIELGKIVNLDTLDLSDNFLSGSIPESVGDLEHLLRLNLSGNHLSGPIPEEFGNLRSVQLIDLSHNMISGSIPEQLGQLQSIESLVLNNNNLSGGIPNVLINCFSLTSLNLSYNNLSGQVPPFKNHSPFSPESFVGNPGLCGPGCLARVRRSKGQPGGISGAAAACISLGGLAVLVMVTVAVHRFRRRPGPGRKIPPAPPKLVVLQMDMAMHTYDDIMRATDNLSDKHKVGQGASSAVYRCALKNCKPIAVKKLCNSNPNNLREFETELATVGSIRHRNLVSLHGYAISPLGNLLFYDFMPNGSLWDLLHGARKKVKLEWEARVRMAVGAAQGLAYLHHDCDPRVIHRDVKSSNILLDENFEARLSDFGIARRISPAKAHASTLVVGTIGYIDPEYARTSRLSDKSDVYAFGVVLLELLTGRKPVDGDSNLHQLISAKVDDDTIMEAVDEEVKETCEDLSQVRRAMQLALLCTKRHAWERPPMNEVARVLISLLLPPAAAAKPPPKAAAEPIDYTRLLAGSDLTAQIDDRSSSDAHWFLKFGEVISKNSL
ncbi:ERECTA-like 1 [Wolffia australiana]